ncbi:MAG TPA: trypsin-like peptidase domain-containing protein [Candidatus Saccharimonadales bacterium]|nr:trypsin-like peptidase domain-containing protein [Candidatus Saccharimonadales bacterium]
MDTNDNTPENEVTEKTVTATSVKSRRTRIITAAIFAVIIVIVIVIAIFFNQIEQTLKNNNAITNRETTQNDGNKTVTQEEEDIASVVSKVSPSVVSVLTKSQGASTFGTTEQEGAGTGIIVGKDGYILTNKHVVDGANTVSVVLSDGTSYDNVKVLGTDPLNDVAFLKVPDVKDLPVAELGDSTSIRVGQKVIAIGNSLGQYQNTVTSGIISGTGRPISAQSGQTVESLTDLIQTDAAINPGNSGGPLLNLQGQVIGINTAIIEDAQGIGFAIPISSTKGILKGVLAGKSVERAYLGVSYIPITADVAKQYSLSVKKGAYVFSSSGTTAVVAGSPAEKAGLKDKDIITKVGDIEVGDRGSISTLVAEYAPGDTIQLTVLRGGQTINVKVTLAAYKS